MRMPLKTHRVALGTGGSPPNLDLLRPGNSHTLKYIRNFIIDACHVRFENMSSEEA